MSVRNSNTTADYVPWARAVQLVKDLHADGLHRESLLVGCGIFFGLRIGDLLSLTWKDILGVDEIVLRERKTGKRRVIRVGRAFGRHILRCHRDMGIRDDSAPCFLSRYGKVLSVQMVNRILKRVRVRYRIPVRNFSTHSFRKTWARKIYENELKEGRGEMALLKLSELMNHSSPAITRRYIGLRQEELARMYDGLKF